MSLTFSVIAVSLGGPPDFFASFLFLFHFVAFGIAQSSDGVVSAREVKKKKKGAILLSGDATNMTPLMTTSTERETLTRHQNVHLRPSRWKLWFSDGFFCRAVNRCCLRSWQEMRPRGNSIGVFFLVFPPLFATICGKVVRPRWHRLAASWWKEGFQVSSGFQSFSCPYSFLPKTN